MSQPIYLDTARFGAILPKCAAMLHEFASVLEAESQFPEFADFLCEGSMAWPERVRQQFPTLAEWQGIESLRSQVRSCFVPDLRSEVLFSSSSWQMMRAACSILTSRCERLLCTDLDWPEFQTMLRDEARRSGCELTCYSLRQFPYPEFSMQERSDAMATYCRDSGFDGMFLTPVSNEGISIDVAHFLSQLNHRPRYCVVDGCQQAGHLPVTLPPGFEGMYVTGTHKWLRSGMPLTVAALAYTNDNPLRSIRKLIRCRQIDDQLMLQTTDNNLEYSQQTVRLEPLLAASIALQNLQQSCVPGQLAARSQNSEILRDLIRPQEWRTEPLQKNGIIVLSSEFDTATRARMALARHGITVSEIGMQRLRMSCPAERFTNDQIEHLHTAISELTPAEYLWGSP